MMKKDLLQFENKPEHVKQVSHYFVLQMTLAKLLQELTIVELAESETLHKFIQSEKDFDDCNLLSNKDLERMLKNIEAFAFVLHRGHDAMKRFLVNDETPEHIQSVDNFIDYVLDLGALDKIKPTR